MSYNVGYALSLSITERDGLWKIEFPHPLDAGNKQTAWLSMNPDDDRVGNVIQDAEVAEVGPLLSEVLGWLYDRLTNYPYYWPWEGTYVDKFGYDFTVEMNEGSDNRVNNVELTTIAYNIIKEKLDIQPPKDTEEVVEQEVLELPAGGAYVKYIVTLNKSKPVSEISVTPFTELKMDLMSVMYEEDIETYHPRKELLLENQPEASTGTMTIKFPVVMARRFTIILRQVNYKKHTYLTNEAATNKKKLWSQISSRVGNPVIDLRDTSQVDQSQSENLTGWQIYFKELQKYNEEYAEWERKMKKYSEQVSYRDQKIAQKRAAQRQYTEEMSVYRAEYKKAQEKYNEQVSAYKKDLESYQVSKARYERDLQLYNKYLRDLKAWNSKWG